MWACGLLALVFCGLPTANCRLPTADCRLPTAKVSGFFAVFVALLFGFAQAHVIVYSGDMLGFATVGSGMFSLTR